LHPNIFIPIFDFSAKHGGSLSILAFFNGLKTDKIVHQSSFAQLYRLLSKLNIDAQLRSVIFLFELFFHALFGQLKLERSMNAIVGIDSAVHIASQYFDILTLLLHLLFPKYLEI